MRAWLWEQTVEDRRALGRAIATVELGWPVGMPVCRSITSRRGLREVRTGLSGGRIARVLFCIHDGRMVLLHAFVKKTQKTPDDELDLAVRRQKELE